MHQNQAAHSVFHLQSFQEARPPLKGKRSSRDDGAHGRAGRDRRWERCARVVRDDTKPQLADVREYREAPQIIDVVHGRLHGPDVIAAVDDRLQVGEDAAELGREVLGRRQRVTVTRGQERGQRHETRGLVAGGARGPAVLVADHVAGGGGEVDRAGGEEAGSGLVEEGVDVEDVGLPGVDVGDHGGDGVGLALCGGGQG